MKKPHERTTLAHVARQAGVAESTASRVLNGYTENFRVRPEVRQRVLDAASELNYRPNPMVRSISAKTTNLVAVVGWASDGVNRSALSEAVRLCRDAGKHVCTTFLTPSNSGHELPSWRVDGAIVLQAREMADLAELEIHEMPYVSINGLSGPGGDSVTFDEAEGMEQALDHLCALGHTKIAFCYLDRMRVNPRGLRHASVALRRDAFVEGLSKRNLEPMPGWDHFAGEYADWVRQYLVGTGATAVIAYDDVMALFMIQHAHAAGLRVPEDLSVVAFNEELPGRMSSPPLTTVALPAAEAGTRAAELLLRRLEVDEPPESISVVLGPSLVVRKSTAPAKSG